MESKLTVDQRRYYSTYYGHRPDYLAIIHSSQRHMDADAERKEQQEQREAHHRAPRRTIFLAGDSSLDNKYWFSQTAAALNGYEQILQPPIMKQDVTYWLNKECVNRGVNMYCLNTAVEATSLNSRPLCTLLEQDEFIRDHITEDDTLIVSVGGNDIALSPLLCTILNISALVCCTPQFCIEECACACPPNNHLDCGCMCCGVPGCLSGLLCGWPVGMGYFVDMFKNRVGDYIRKLVAKRKPRSVIVCMIYYPDERAGGSWADGSLSVMCYNCNPRKLQCMIRKVFELGTSAIRIDGTEVVPFPLFQVLDGSNSEDYLERVEPSPIGGRKMAAALMDAVLKDQIGSSAASGSVKVKEATAGTSLKGAKGSTTGYSEM